MTDHTWVIDVDRVWKGADKLAGQVRLLDVYNGIDCEFPTLVRRDLIVIAP